MAALMFFCTALVLNVAPVHPSMSVRWASFLAFEILRLLYSGSRNCLTREK